jgi:hypothetical protein
MLIPATAPGPSPVSLVGVGLAVREEALDDMEFEEDVLCGCGRVLLESAIYVVVGELSDVVPVAEEEPDAVLWLPDGILLVEDVIVVSTCASVVVVVG